MIQLLCFNQYLIANQFSHFLSMLRVLKVLCMTAIANHKLDTIMSKKLRVRVRAKRKVDEFPSSFFLFIGSVCMRQSHPGNRHTFFLSFFLSLFRVLRSVDHRPNATTASQEHQPTQATGNKKRNSKRSHSQNV